jgi:hypothetical protein
VRTDNLDDFLTDWYGPPSRASALTVRASVQVPTTLAKWHATALKWDRGVVLSLNHFVELDDLTVDIDGMMVFWCESQGAWEWGADPVSDDPIVYGRQSDELGWHSTGQRMSDFLRFATLMEAVEGASISAYAPRLTNHELSEICAPLHKIATSAPIGYMSSSQFFAGEMLLARSSSKGTGGRTPSSVSYNNSLVLAALSRDVLDRFLRSSGEVAWRIFDAADRRSAPPLPF